MPIGEIDDARTVQFEMRRLGSIGRRGMRISSFAVIVAALANVASPSLATADEAWLLGGRVAAAAPLGGVQGSDFGLGADVSAAALKPLTAWAALGIDIGLLALLDGGDPGDDRVNRGAGSLARASVAASFFPLSPKENGSGLSISVATGPSISGGNFGWSVEGRVGWMVPLGSFRIGPVLGYQHVFDGSAAPGGDALKVATLGVQVNFARIVAKSEDDEDVAYDDSSSVDDVSAADLGIEPAASPTAPQRSVKDEPIKSSPVPSSEPTRSDSKVARVPTPPKPSAKVPTPVPESPSPKPVVAPKSEPVSPRAPAEDKEQAPASVTGDGDGFAVLERTGSARFDAGVFFKRGKGRVSRTGREGIARVAATWKSQRRQGKLTIVGIGKDLNTGQRRARNVMRELSKAGISESRIEWTGEKKSDAGDGLIIVKFGSQP